MQYCVFLRGMTTYTKLQPLSQPLPGFQSIQLDRDLRGSGKSKGGCIAVLVNKEWCDPRHVSEKEISTSQDIQPCLPLCCASNFPTTAPPEKIKHWTYVMSM